MQSVNYTAITCTDRQGDRREYHMQICAQSPSIQMQRWPVLWHTVMLWSESVNILQARVESVTWCLVLVRQWYGEYHYLPTAQSKGGMRETCVRKMCICQWHVIHLLFYLYICQIKYYIIICVGGGAGDKGGVHQLNSCRFKPCSTWPNRSFLEQDIKPQISPGMQWMSTRSREHKLYVWWWMKHSLLLNFKFSWNGNKTKLGTKDLILSTPWISANIWLWICLFVFMNKNAVHSMVLLIYC